MILVVLFCFNLGFGFNCFLGLRCFAFCLYSVTLVFGLCFGLSLYFLGFALLWVCCLGNCGCGCDCFDFWLFYGFCCYCGLLGFA